MYSYQIDKKIFPKWPVCLFCKYIITIQSFTIHYVNDFYINYKCGCKKEVKMLLKKYLYGLELMRSISSWYMKCKEIPNPSYLYCITCKCGLC